MALSSGKYFFSKSLHAPELDDVCDTTKYIDYEKEVQKNYHLTTGGVLPAKIPNRTIMFFGSKSTMYKSYSKSPSKSKSKSKTRNSKEAESTPKKEKHATFDLSSSQEQKTQNVEEEKTETIIYNTIQEDPLESVSDSDENPNYSTQQNEQLETKVEDVNNNDHQLGSDQPPIDEADDEGSCDDNYSDRSDN